MAAEARVVLFDYLITFCLFMLGVVLAICGVFAVNTPTVQLALILGGLTLSIVSALLPRLEGDFELSLTKVKFSVARKTGPDPRSTQRRRR